MKGKKVEERKRKEGSEGRERVCCVVSGKKMRIII